MLETSARLLRLLSMLQVRPEWAGADLAARLGVTTRTLRRDVQRLRGLGYPVHATPGVAGATGSGRAAPCRHCCWTTRRRPHRLVHAGHRWYLVARDPDRDDWRNFRADRIDHPVATGVRFVPQDPPDAAAFVADSVSAAQYRFRARVIVHAPAQVIAERIPPSAGVLEPAGPGRCLLTTGADSIDMIVIHLGLLRSDFTVLEPAELIEQVRALAGRLRRAVP